MRAGRGVDDDDEEDNEEDDDDENNENGDDARDPDHTRRCRPAGRRRSQSTDSARI